MSGPNVERIAGAAARALTAVFGDWRKEADLDEVVYAVIYALRSPGDDVLAATGNSLEGWRAGIEILLKR